MCPRDAELRHDPVSTGAPGYECGRNCLEMPELETAAFSFREAIVWWAASCFAESEIRWCRLDMDQGMSSR